MATLSLPSLNFAVRVLIVLFIVGLVLKFVPQLGGVRQYLL